MDDLGVDSYAGRHVARVKEAGARGEEKPRKVRIAPTDFSRKNSHSIEGPATVPTVPAARKARGTYAEFLAQVIAARKTLTGLGYRTQGRIEIYERTLQRLTAAMPDRFAAEFTEEEAGEAILMFPEVTEFLYVMDALPHSPHLVKHPRFKEILSGDALTSGEQKTTPRNTLFELTIAALLERAGLSASLDAVADVETVYQNIPLLIECKRIQNFDKLEARMGEAHHQLGPRLLARGKGSVGLVALSISKALTKGTKKLTTVDAAQMDAAMTELLRMGQRNLAPFWDRYTNFDGVLAHVCVAGKMGGPYVNTQYGLLVRPELSEPRVVFLRSLLEAIKVARW